MIATRTNYKQITTHLSMTPIFERSSVLLVHLVIGFILLRETASLLQIADRDIRVFKFSLYLRGGFASLPQIADLGGETFASLKHRVYRLQS